MTITPRKMTDEQIVQSCLFEPHYSSLASERFWNEIRNPANDRTLYDFACALQDIERRLLSALNEGVALRARIHLRHKRRKKTQHATR